jgi:hypothetical protein
MFFIKKNKFSDKKKILISFYSKNKKLKKTDNNLIKNNKVKTHLHFRVKKECFFKKNIYINLLINNVTNVNSNISKKEIISIKFYNSLYFFIKKNMFDIKINKVKQIFYLYINSLVYFKEYIKDL